MLARYDPESAPDPQQWLRADDEERLQLIQRAHRRLRIGLPNERLHAIFHLIVENQVAMAEETPVAATVQRLVDEGLTRHEAVHAVGSVLAAHMHDLAGEQADPNVDPNVPYFRELRKLTAASWLRQFE